MAVFGVRLVAYEPAGDRLGLMPRPLKATAAFPHNDVGALSAKYSRLALGGGFLDRALSDGLELAVEVVNHAGAWVEPDGARYLWVARKDDIADQTLTVDVTAPSYGWLLNKSRLLDLTDLLPEEHTQAGKRPFLSASAGLIVATLQQENAARGGVPLTLGFDTGVDSAGAPWALESTLYYEPGISTMTVLENLAAQGLCDWRTAARELLLYNPDTALAPDLTLGDNPVALQLGLDVTEAPSDQSLEEIVSRVLLRGDDGLVLTLDNPTAPTPWGPWEGYIEQGGVSDAGTATSLVQTELERTARTRAQFTRGLLLRDDETPDGDDAPGVAWPMVDYAPGAWILGPTTVTSERVRVQQVTLTWGQDDVGGSVVLHDRVLDAELRRAKRQAGIVGGSTAGGAGGGRPVDPTQDRRTPSAPLGLVLDSDAYIGTDGQAHGLITATWSDVTTATDSTTLDVAGYDIAIREPAEVWAVVGSSDDASWAGSPYEPGSTLEVRVRARGQYTTKPGLWSTVESVVVASDVTPPAVPSTPTVASRVGVITVSWDGKSSTGTAMDADFSHVEVAMGDTTTPTAVIGSLQLDGSLLVQDQPYGADRYFRLRSVDTSDNASAWSEVSAPIAALSVAQADIDAAIAAAIAEGENAWTTAQRLLLTSVDNICDDPSFATFGTPLSRWGVTSANRMPDPTGGRQGGPSLKVIANGALHTTTGGNAWVKSAPGGAYRVGVWVYSDVAIPVNGAYVWVQGRNATGDGTHVADLFTPAIPAATWTWIQSPPGVSTPETVEIRTVVQVRPEMASGTVWIDGVTVTRAADASLVVDGSITALKLAANSVTANAVQAGAIDGMVITGAIVQTATSGARMVLTGAGGVPGVWAYDSAGQTRASMQVTPAGEPGFFLWDTAGVTRVWLYTAGTQSVLAFRDPSNNEVLKITDNQFQILNGGNLFVDAGGVFASRHPGGDYATVIGVDSDGDYGTAVYKPGFVRIFDAGFILSSNESYVRVGVASDPVTQFRVESGPITMRVNGLGNSLFLTTDRDTAGTKDGIVSLRFGGINGANNRSIEIADEASVVARFRSDGLYLYGVGSGSGSSLVLSGSRVVTSSSSARFKQDIEPHELDTTALLGLPVRSWRARSEVAENPETTNRYVGFIAEDLHAAGLTEAVLYEADGVPRDLADRALIAGLLQVAQQHAARLDALDGGPAPLAKASRTLTATSETTSPVMALLPAADTDRTPVEPPPSPAGALTLPVRDTPPAPEISPPTIPQETPRDDDTE